MDEAEEDSGEPAPPQAVNIKARTILPIKYVVMLRFLGERMRYITLSLPADPPLVYCSHDQPVISNPIIGPRHFTRSNLGVTIGLS
ncbi:hypothetical protein DCC25_03610 [Auritidibacter sp. NML120636]|nr:hypothetical protein DCC25_03610 [Auritidibacter sp. NML120636]